MGHNGAIATCVKMFEWLSRFDTILVTGPQRSGSRICAKMIAHDTGHEYIDEDDLEMESLYRLCSIMGERRNIVVQCPVLCRYVHMFGTDEVAVVLMRRKVEDIIASQQRISWTWEWLELARYDRVDGIIAEIKYQFWEQYQKKRIKHAFEIEYDSLAAHPLWVKKDKRQNFNARQTAGSIQLLPIGPNARCIPYSSVYYLDELDQDSAILVKTQGNARLLNDTGRFIWNLCDGTHTYQDILRSLCVEYIDMKEDTLVSDLNTFLSDLITNGFLRKNESGILSTNVKN